jgi:hypothetical protein
MFSRPHTQTSEFPSLSNNISPCHHACRSRIAGREESPTPTLNKPRPDVSSVAIPIHHHWNNVSRLSLDVLNLEVNVGATLGQRSVEAGKTEEQLRDACDEGKRAVSDRVLCAEVFKQERRRTMPPGTDHPTVELAAGSLRAGSAVPLQSSGVDEEAMAACVRTAVAKVDAYRLPAGVGDLGGVHVHGPVSCQLE